MLPSQPDQILLDNVANDELYKLVRGFLVEVYEIDRVVLCPEMFCHPFRRVRQLIFGGTDGTHMHMNIALHHRISSTPARLL